TYIMRALSPTRIERGREILESSPNILKTVAERHQIPPEIIIAFWGLETNFGDYLGKIDTFHALATLAYDPRRSKFFRTELLHSLRLLDSGKLPRAQFMGSWAGAMGHMQFMPSTLQAYGIDGNQNNVINLRGEIADALLSAGNFLQAIGWNKTIPWGCEVTLPADFSYTSITKDMRPLRVWRAMGVEVLTGCTFDDASKARMLLPAGASGPKFLLSDNFAVILRWNRSNFYALAVGILSDRIAGRAGMVHPLPNNVEKWDRNFIKFVQTRLNILGFDAGEVDGIMGSKTRDALRWFQISQHLPADGYPDNNTLALLRAQKGVAAQK
ncbi:MAG: lytic murein transglycosylase, partial [Pseudomonadota bacterium]